MVNPTHFALFSQLSAQARAANTLAELTFSVVNDSYALLPFRQAQAWREDAGGGELLAVSGLANPAEDSPYLFWLRRLWPWLRTQLPAEGGWFVPAATGEGALPGDLRDGWAEWWPQGVLALRLRRRDGAPLGVLLFLLDAPPDMACAQSLAALAPVWAYSWEMLAGPARPGLQARWRALGKRRLLLLAALLLLALPVPQSALAPAEVIALDAEVAAAPLDGVLKQVHVRPNQTVRRGDPLFSLDDTTLRNRLEVSRKGVHVASAELLAATQKAFDQPQSKAELALLNGRVQERQAELAAIQAQLERVTVLAARDGVAVFGDANDWLGKPVVTGERIMLLADPARPGVLIHLPVADAVALEPGAPVRLFLSAHPLSPLSAELLETSYQALLSPEGVASYRLRAGFVPGEDLSAARIGLRGTAKIAASRVALGYYLLRRPLARLREWSGW